MTSTLTRWDPFTEIRTSMDRAFDRRLRPANGTSVRQTPSINLNVSETDDAFLVEAAVAGVTPEDVEIKLEDSVLTIKGTFFSREEGENERYIRREIRSGSFERSLRLGPTVDVEKVEASFKNGLLTLSLPKRAEAKARTIKVATK